MGYLSGIQESPGQMAQAGLDAWEREGRKIEIKKAKSELQKAYQVIEQFKLALQNHKNVIQEKNKELDKAYDSYLQLKAIDMLRKSTVRYAKKKKKDSMALYSESFADLQKRYIKYMEKHGARKLIKNCQTAIDQDKIFYPEN